jgi:GT2 family glycosyltransferase
LGPLAKKEPDRFLMTSDDRARPDDGPKSTFSGATAAVAGRSREGRSREGAADPRVAVVLVDYENLTDTLACIRSAKDLDYSNADLIVVDNGSKAREDQAIAREFGDGVIAIRSDRNGGFAAGANIGIRAGLELGAEYIWLVNNDTLVEPASLGRLIEAMESAPGFGIATPVVLGSENASWSSDIWFAGGTVELARGIAAHLTAPLDGDALVETEYVSGCAMLIRREVLDQIGLLDESYFMFWEDVEMSLRARRSGWRCGVLPTARILHKVHGTIGRRTFSFLSIRNGRDVCGRYGTAREVAGILARSGLGMIRALAALPGGGERRAAAREELRGHLYGIGRLARAVARRALGRSRPDPRTPTAIPGA